MTDGVFFSVTIKHTVLCFSLIHFMLIEPFNVPLRAWKIPLLWIHPSSPSLCPLSAWALLSLSHQLSLREHDLSTINAIKVPITLPSFAPAGSARPSSPQLATVFNMHSRFLYQHDHNEIECWCRIMPLRQRERKKIRLRWLDKSQPDT